MMDQLIRWSLNNRNWVLVSASVLCAYGTWAAVRLPVDVFPDLTAPTVTILCDGHGLAPTDMESQVTRQIEAAINGAPGVRRVRSSTSIGFAVIYAEFDWNADPTDARRGITERLAIVAAELPEEATPVIAPMTSIMGEILFLAVVPGTADPLEVRSFADTRLRRRLLAIPGVAQATVIGGDAKQYRVTLSPAKLQSYGVSVHAVAEALKTDNENAAAGFANRAGSEYIIAGRGRFLGLEDIGNVVVRTDGTIPVLVRDLGRVEISVAPKRGVAAVRGTSAVVISVQKQPEANTLELTRRIDAVLDELEEDLPPGASLERNTFRQSDFIEVAVRNVLHALRDGGILVILIMILFLANARATFITLTAIPLSLVAAVLTLEHFGGSINTMTLGGMAIAIGALVDDAVIDVENVMRRLRQNSLLPETEQRSAIRVVFEASKEIRNSIAFATLIVMLVFVPVFFLPGVEGRLLKPLGTAYVVSLFASLIVALTITPALCLVLLPRSRSIQEAREPRLARKIRDLYGRALERILDRPKTVLLPTLALLVAAAIAIALVGRAFLPDFNEGSLTINVTTVPGISLPESDKLAGLAENILLEHPEVVSTCRRTGRGEMDEHAAGVNSTEIEVTLRPGDRSKAEFLSALREDLARVPGVDVIVGQPISHRIDHMLSGTRANLAVKVFGPDLYELRNIGEEVRARIQSVAGVVDLSVEQQTDIPILSVRYRREEMARHGLRVEDVSHTLEAAFDGLEVSSIFEDESSFDLVVRLEGDDPFGVDGAERIPLDSISGAKIPLGAVADVVRDKGPNTVIREQVERKIVVQANVSGRAISDVVEEIRARVDPFLAPRSEYRVEYGGQFESAAAANRVLLLLGVVVIAGIAFLLHLAFHSLRDAFFIMANLPLALIGAVAGVFVSGGVLSVASMIGFITVFGIATRNGIMLVSHVRHLQREEGVDDFREAVQRGSVERLLPILMTALGTALALVPLALSQGTPGNEIQTPMAIVILFGLFSATFLNMVVVPVLFLRFGKRQSSERGGV